ncbi:MAG: hypothetical protein KatS3mg080_0492 [Anoxybacillus sp.]|nr:MAG: hypothetical protein KatS3mg080_0492 [Anoxybacillus sp.]
MEHKKTYNAKQLKTPKGTLIIEGPISPEKLASYEFHHDLTAFRQPHQQHQALIEIARPSRRTNYYCTPRSYDRWLRHVFIS